MFFLNGKITELSVGAGAGQTNPGQVAPDATFQSYHALYEHAHGRYEIALEHIRHEGSWSPYDTGRRQPQTGYEGAAILMELDPNDLIDEADDNVAQGS